MADLLRSGSTMLNLACSVCNNPIFRNRDGNTYCPTCNRKVIITNDKNDRNNGIERSNIYSNQEHNTIKQNYQFNWLNLLQDVIIEKINLITTKLKDESQLQLIETYTELLRNFFDVLSKIQIYRETI